MIRRASPYVLGLALLALGVTQAVPKSFAAVAGVVGVLAIVAGAVMSVRHGLREGPFVHDGTGANAEYGPTWSGPPGGSGHHHAAGFHGGFGAHGGGHGGGGHGGH
jgi:hypothetical protein